MNKEYNTKAVTIISKLINLVGVTAGIILVSIGGIMLLQAMLKLYVFGIEQGRFASQDYFTCGVYDIDRMHAQSLTHIPSGPQPLEIAPPKFATQKPAKTYEDLSAEDKEFLRTKYEECIKKEKEGQIKSFKRDKKMDIADGVAFLLIGALLLFFYQRKKKK